METREIMLQGCMPEVECALGAQTPGLQPCNGVLDCPEGHTEHWVLLLVPCCSCSHQAPLGAGLSLHPGRSMELLQGREA